MEFKKASTSIENEGRPKVSTSCSGSGSDNPRQLVVGRQIIYCKTVAVQQDGQKIQLEAVRQLRLVLADFLKSCTPMTLRSKFCPLFV